MIRIVSRQVVLALVLLCFSPVIAVAKTTDVTTYKNNTVSLKNDLSIKSIEIKSVFYEYNSGFDRPLTTDGEPAYDYSVHIMKDGSMYRMYTGGRWRVKNNENLIDGDHILLHVSKTGNPGSWKMLYDRPELWNGNDVGDVGKWYSHNTLEPEVMKVNAKYYMWTQVEIDPNEPIDIPGEKAACQADRIQLFTSKDGSDWKRKCDRGVVINVPDPAITMFHHEEMLYVPWDKDNKPFWMYVCADRNGYPRQHYRYRSSDPTTFDYSRRERVVGLGQLGNQMSYAKQAPGGPLFIRITYTDAIDKNGEKRATPSLQFSRDGICWTSADDLSATLDGSHNNTLYKGCYFLGISTINGTGELEYVGDNTFKAIYGACTCNSPVVPEIWNSEIGIGELIIKINPKDK